MARAYILGILICLGVLAPIAGLAYLEIISTEMVEATWPISNEGVAIPHMVSLTGSISETISPELEPEDEPDFLFYFPLILKSFDPTQPWHGLAVGKTAFPNPAPPGSPLTYTIRYTVSGNEPASGLTVVDTIPPSTTYQSCSGGLNCNVIDQTVIWNLGNPAPYVSGVVTMVVQVDSAAISGTILYNTVILSDTSGLSATKHITTPVKQYGINPYIIVYDDLGDFIEPAGGRFTVSVNDHLPNGDYRLWFARQDGNFIDSLEFTTDSMGGKLLTFNISVLTPPTDPLPPAGAPDYRIYTTLANDPGIPIATCLGDLPTNAPCFSVAPDNAVITARNINTTDQQQQPIEPARWPISSSIPIYLFGHDVNSNYTITFDGQPSPSAPGTLWFEGAQVTQIPTDSQFGANRNGSPAFYIATGHTPGVTMTITSNDAGFEVASTTVEFSQAEIDIFGETATSTHPQGDVLEISLRNLAPRQEYRILFDDGVSAPVIIRANDDGTIILFFVVPYSSHIPGDPPKPVEIIGVDYGRGSNPNKIASRLIRLYTPLTPYINVPRLSAPIGSPIFIRIRRHEAETDYAIYLQQDPPAAPTFSQLMANVHTENNPVTGLGDYDLAYVMPASLNGNYVIRSFLPSNLAYPVAEHELRVISSTLTLAGDASR